MTTTVSPSSIIKSPAVVLDEEDDETMVDPDTSSQANIDHSRYWKLVDRLDEDSWSPLITIAYEDELKTESTYIRGVSNKAWMLAADEALATMIPPS